jgi:hypothetical protein
MVGSRQRRRVSEGEGVEAEGSESQPWLTTKVASAAFLIIQVRLSDNCKVNGGKTKVLYCRITIETISLIGIL